MTDLDDDRLILPPGPDVPLDLSSVERRVVRRRTLRRVGAGAVGVVLLATGGLVASRAGDDAQTGPAGNGEIPSPLFDEVEQLAPTSLPAGWARCGGGPSDRPDAANDWWAQTFGPVVDGECTALVTVTQVPPGDKVRIPEGATNGGIGEEPGRTGAKHWSDEAEGSRGLYTGGSGGLQQLVVEGCCGPEATGDDLLLVAEAARDATREEEPARCTAPASDLDQESFLDNSFGRLDRVHDEEGCPIRRDIISWRTEPPEAHCWANIVFLVIGTPVGTPYDGATARLYVRDPNGELAGGPPISAPDLDAALPATAVNTGWSQDGRTLWIDEADGEWVYLVSDDGVEAWPRDRRGHGCG
jgi:hypothetical protein